MTDWRTQELKDDLEATRGALEVAMKRIAQAEASAAHLKATNAALANRVQDLEAALDKAADDVAFLRNRLDVQAEQDAAALRDAQDDAARLRAALEQVEFVSDDMCTYCPWCDANDNDMVIGDDRYKIQHKPDCLRQAALAQSEVKA